MGETRVLLLEDNPDDAALVERALRGANVKLTHVQDMRSFERLLEPQSFDLVLSDFELPGGSTYDVLNILKTRGLNMPVIVVSGTIGEEIAVDVMRAGARDYVMKDRLQRLPLSIARALEEAAAFRKQREIEEALASIITSAMDGIITIDADARIVLFNPAAERMFGYSSAEVKGQALDVLLPEHFRGLHTARIQEFADSGATSRRMGTGVVSGRKRDGSLFPMEVSISRVPMETGMFMTAICRDMTEQVRTAERNKSLEKQLIQSQKLEALGILAGGVAHEINNPLNIVMNYAQLIRDFPDLPEKARSYSDGISVASERIARIVRDVLSFSRKDPADFETARMSDIVHVSAGLLTSRLKTSRASFQIEIPDGLPPIRCVPQRIEQVLINLIGNSLDAVENQLDARVFLKVFHEPDVREFRLVVEDNGPGIPAGMIHQIFDPFFTTKSAGKGTGLGLSVSYGIVQQHKGKIEVETEPGCTRFTVRLPECPPRT